MPIIFSDANAYQEDLGPSEGEMFFTNLLSGLQKGVEEGGRRKYAQELRQQELADRLSAEQRQQGYIMGAEQRLRDYMTEAEKRRVAAQEASEERLFAKQRTLADEASEREQKKWEKRGGQLGVEADKLKLEEAQRQAQQAATETSRQTMAESAMGDLAGLLQMPGGVPYAPDPDIDARVQFALDKIADRAKSITDSVARNRFMDQANARLRNELQMFTEQQRAKQQAEEQRRAEENREIDAEVAKAHIDSGGRFIPQDDKDFVVRGLSARESAYNSLYKKGRLTPVKWAEMVGKLFSEYQKYESDRQQRQVEALKAWLKSQGGGGTTNDMAFEGAMGNAPVWNFPSGTQVPAGDIIEDDITFKGVMGNGPVRLFPSGTQLPAGGIVNQAEEFLRLQQ